MNTKLSNFLLTSAVVVSAPIWIPYELVTGIIGKISKKEDKQETNEDKPEKQDDLEKEKEVETLDLINPTKIKGKKLFYPSEIEIQIEDIARSLKQTEYKSMQKMMIEEGLGEGFIALFYGEPGTGKTESVLQIAKLCNRNVFSVDMAEIVSKWIGETGHRVRQTFKKYKKYCRIAEKNNKPIPIMLLNEADALIGKRHSFDSGSSPIGIQDNNQVQGILLEEFEKNKGIIILTTNMACNLDSAFESRIFEKIHFNIPDISTREKIWKDKIPELDDISISYLSKEFDFSGRDINHAVRNIKKKKILSESKQLPDFDTICLICENMKIKSKTKQ